MINKQGLWFLTLFSIILVLSVYYIAMPNDTLSVLKEKNDDSISTFNISEDDSLTALRVKNDEETQNIINELQSILLNEKTTLEEKNKAYDDIQNINSNKGKEQNIEKTTASAQTIFDAPDIGLSRTDIALRIIGFFAARAMPYPMGAPFGISFLSSERRFGIGAIIGCAATALGYASLFDIRLAAKYICCSFAYLLFLFVTDNRGRDLSSAVAIDS